MPITITGGVQLSGPVVLTQSSGGGGGVSPFQGENFGYIMGGRNPSGGFNTIEKYSFTTDQNNTISGNITETREYIDGGNSSSVHGYLTGGRVTNTSTTNKIEKFAFASDGNTTSNAVLVNGGSVNTGFSSTTDGYSYGGETGPNGAYMFKTDKFPFASDTDSTDLGSLNTYRYIGGCSSSDSGYLIGGRTAPSTYHTFIRKFEFSNDTTIVDHSDLTTGTDYMLGLNSDTHGYSIKFDMEKFSFSSQTTATNVVTLSGGYRSGKSGSSSTQSGYIANKTTPSGTLGTVVEKFPFSNESSITEVGDLVTPRDGGASAQY